MIAVTFALPQESRDFRAKLRSAGGSAGHISEAILGNLGDCEVLLAHTGVGKARAAEAMRSLLAMHRPSVLLSAGFAGGLDLELPVGQLVAATNFSHMEMLSVVQRKMNARVRFGPMVTVDELLETAEQKRALRERTGALAADMETAVIHAECARTGIPMLSLRVISDAASDSLPVPLSIWFDEKRQRPRPLRLVSHLARHPSLIRRFVRFVQGVEIARAELTSAVALLVPGLSLTR
jgi:adenosylhomocysteine nucleosidase